MLVDRGLIASDLAQDWIDRQREVKVKKAAEELLQKAENGNSFAMTEVALNHASGLNGFEESPTKTFEWFERADAAGNLLAKFHLAEMLLIGKGVPRNQTLGMLNLALAAERGCDHAAFWLGIHFFDGSHGLPKDKGKAMAWLNKSLSPNCSLKCMSDSDKVLARQVRDEIVDAWLSG